MSVAELIKALQEHPPTAQVYYPDSEYSEFETIGEVSKVCDSTYLYDRRGILADAVLLESKIT